MVRRESKASCFEVCGVRCDGNMQQRQNVVHLYERGEEFLTLAAKRWYSVQVRQPQYAGELVHRETVVHGARIHPNQQLLERDRPAVCHADPADRDACETVRGAPDARPRADVNLALRHAASEHAPEVLRPGYQDRHVRPQHLASDLETNVSIMLVFQKYPHVGANCLWTPQWRRCPLMQLHFRHGHHCVRRRLVGAKIVDWHTRRVEATTAHKRDAPRVQASVVCRRQAMPRTASDERNLFPPHTTVDNLSWHGLVRTVLIGWEAGDVGEAAAAGSCGAPSVQLTFLCDSQAVPRAARHGTNHATRSKATYQAGHRLVMPIVVRRHALRVPQTATPRVGIAPRAELAVGRDGITMSFAASRGNDRATAEVPIDNLAWYRLVLYAVVVNGQALEAREAAAAGASTAPAEQLPGLCHGEAMERPARHRRNPVTIQGTSRDPAWYGLVWVVFVVDRQAIHVGEAATAHVEASPGKKLPVRGHHETVVFAASDDHDLPAVECASHDQPRHWLVWPIVLVARHVRGVGEATSPSISSAPSVKLAAFYDRQVVPSSTRDGHDLLVGKTATDDLTRDRLVWNIVVGRHAGHVCDTAPASIRFAPSVQTAAGRDSEAMRVPADDGGQHRLHADV
mmetsp:Transcript_25453/g.70988  ORF Transcript_25453/g.70988 Transcript_25453/m.70988 type:complete len:627 (-) Transcript_25453:279-2159(-)